MSKPNENRFKAETLYKKGLSYKEISERLGTPEPTIRRWKSTYKWENSNNPNTRTKTPEQKEKKKRGGQKGNVNAVGNNGGAPSGNTNALKHGGYSKILKSTFTEEEAELFSDTPQSELDVMQDEVAVLTVREHRLLQAIKKYTDIKGGQAVQYITSNETKKVFAQDEQQQKDRYEELCQSKRDEDKISYFGKDVNVTTQTEATYNIVLRLERELTAVQKQKHKILETIARIKNERGDGKDDFVEEWFDTLNELEEDDEENESDS